MSDQVPSEVSEFKPIPADGLGLEFKGWHNSQILELEVKDKKQKLVARPVIGICLGLLLFLQNISVYVLVFVAYFQGKVEVLTPVLSIVCTATLIETAAIVHTMVKWIFSDMEYKIR